MDPTAFAAPGQALARGAGQLADVANDWSARYAEARRQADAANITADASAKLGDAQFRWSKTPDNEAAYAGFQAEAAQIKANALAASSDPLVQGYVTRQVDQEAIMRGLDTRNTAFGLESSARRGQLDTRLFQYAQAAATAPTDLQRGYYVDQAKADISGSVAAGWLHPEEGAQRSLQFGSQVAEVQARRDLTADPENALRNLSDPTKYPGLNEEARARLTDRADRRYEVSMRRDIAMQEHEDRMADRDLRQQQGANFAGVVADINDGKSVDVGKLTDMTRAGQLSGSQLDGALAQLRGMANRDDPSVVVNLHRSLNAGTLTNDDVSTALSNGSIKGQTAVDLTKALGATADKQSNAVERSSFATLKTALSGGAVEQGIFKNTAPETQKWAEAQGEWTNRVLVGRQDPLTVLSDMLPRYTQPTADIAALPRPRMGTITGAQDIPKVAAATKQAFDAGQITQSQFTSEAQLLGRYDAIYQQHAAALAATAAAKPGKPAAGKAVGLTPVGDQ